MSRTVHLIGGKAQEKYFNPGPGDEVWGLNGIWKPWVEERWTRFFNLHRYENLVRYGYPIERDVGWVKANPDVSFHTSDRWPELDSVTNHFIFPRIFVEKRTRPRGSYHCGSFDWMVAFAIAVKSFDYIVLHGVSLLIEGGEPISARACLEYWCGVAEGRGISVEVESDCDLFAFYHLVKSNMVYGYDDTPIYEDRTRDLHGDAPYKIADMVD